MKFVEVPSCTPVLLWMLKEHRIKKRKRDGIIRNITAIVSIHYNFSRHRKTLQSAPFRELTQNCCWCLEERMRWRFCSAHSWLLCKFINFIKPTVYVMHQQFNIQQLYALPHTVFMCFVFIWEQTATCATYSVNWLVFITEMKSVYSAVRTGSLNKAYWLRDAPPV